LKLFPLPAESTSMLQTSKYSRRGLLPAIRKQTPLPRPIAFYGYCATITPARSVGHREEQHPLIGLIHDDGQIRELINGHTKRRRAGQALRLNRLERA